MFAEYSRHYRMKLRRAVRRYSEYQAEERAKHAEVAEVAACV